MAAGNLGLDSTFLGQPYVILLLVSTQLPLWSYFPPGPIPIHRALSSLTVWKITFLSKSCSAVILISNGFEGLTTYAAPTAVSSWKLLILSREDYNSPTGQPATAIGKSVATSWPQQFNANHWSSVVNGYKISSLVLLLGSCHSEATSLTSLKIALMSCST